MNLERLKKELTLHEGVEKKIYKDTLGYLTGGIGHLLTKEELKSFKLGDKVSQAQMDEWFEQDIAIAINRAKSILGEQAFEALSDNRQNLMVNLAFNLGNKLGQFVNTLRAIRTGRWQAAHDGLLNSLWAKQVKGRSKQIAESMLTDIPIKL